MERSNAIDVLGRCLRLAVEGRYFPEWEFQTLMAVSREEMETIAEAWPDTPSDCPPAFESPDDARQVAVSNAANNLIGYPHGVDRTRLEDDLGCSVSDIAEALANWRGESSFDGSGKGYFDRLT